MKRIKTIALGLVLVAGVVFAGGSALSKLQAGEQGTASCCTGGVCCVVGAVCCAATAAQ